MRILSLILGFVLLQGCANSASHEVLRTVSVSDSELSCQEIEQEKKKALQIIDEVETDRQDMSGADVIDGLLWFPLNVVAKQANYYSAEKAAHTKLDYLLLLSKENRCPAE